MDREGISMKIEQKPKFQPITITLETQEEAETFWAFISIGESKPTEIWGRLDAMSKQLGNWFSNQAQL